MQDIQLKRSLQQGIQFTQSLPPLSLYIHVPWCVRKCPYCDFNSHAIRGGEHSLGEELEQAYLRALEQDLIGVLPSVWGRPIHTVFIGGGTPSLLSAKAMDGLLTMLRNLFNLAPATEITMEANPGTVEVEKFADFAASGVNRVSLGIQSFDDESLRRLGRIHSSEQAKKAIDVAQKYFSRVNLDLMYALPYQTLEACHQEISTALSFGTEHLSLYNLTLEPNTVFAKYPPEGLPDDDLAGDIQDLLIEETAKAGFEQYEVSAYAQNQARCLHNLNYWQFGDYIGVGPGAHGKISSHDRIVRTARVKNPESWMAKVATGEHVAEERLLMPEELPFEFMLNALRLKQGVPTYYFAERCGVNLSIMTGMIDEAVHKGLLVDDPMRLRATELGWRYLNDLQELFLR
ncbi:radical SAM family heme chaperone HemW [Pelistega europaea]|uniref:Heme chaperone HemW n=1 Tax=Pelistega europaea TaxID=106147 RepID=A0A7Y4LB90_9BURK|nr:radical SAM family heme chaperone HemW [Pelistega europaea]NOL49356.1 oxygen-independent coproporphyrinogen III oxidase-like protein [Pelistega europaea]